MIGCLISAIMNDHLNDRRRPKLSSNRECPNVEIGVPFAAYNFEIVGIVGPLKMLRGITDTSAPVSIKKRNDDKLSFMKRRCMKHPSVASENVGFIRFLLNFRANKACHIL